MDVGTNTHLFSKIANYMDDDDVAIVLAEHKHLVTNLEDHYGVEPQVNNVLRIRTNIDIP